VKQLGREEMKKRRREKRRARKRGKEKEAQYSSVRTKLRWVIMEEGGKSLASA
jgi:hypothetical protein